MRCLRRPFTSAVLPRRGCGSAPWPRRGASAMPAASRCGCAAPLGSISTSLTGAPPSSFEWEPPSEPCHTSVLWSRTWPQPTAVMFLDAASILCLTSVGRANTDEHWLFDDPQLRPNASRPTSGSRSSTSGRRSTSRRPARSRPWTPERARLPQPLCHAPARVTVACAYVRLGGGNRSRPFPRCGRDRERSLSWGAGASPTVAHWAVAGSPTKMRKLRRSTQQPQALELGSFSPHPHDLTASSASLWLSDRPAAPRVETTGLPTHPRHPYPSPGHRRSRSRHHRACFGARWATAATIEMWTFSARFFGVIDML